MAKNKLPAADVTEDPHYHDTWMLLRKYRDVVWSLEVSVRQVRNRFRICLLYTSPSPRDCS